MSLNVSYNANLAIFLQDACLNHQYIRSRDTSTIVERPERVRAVKAGLAVALSRLEELHPTTQPKPLSSSVEGSNVDPSNPDELVKALDQMTLGAPTALNYESKMNPVQIVHSTASVDILNSAAVKFIHGDIDGDVYLEKLKGWVANSVDKISKGESEIPLDLPQGDLYCEPSYSIPTSTDVSLTVVSSVSRFFGCYPRGVGDGLRGRRCCTFQYLSRFSVISSYPQMGFLCCASPRSPLRRRYTLRVLFRQQRSCGCCPR